MSFDLNSMISSLIGSLLAISGSIAVALLYIRNQNKLEEERRMDELLKKTYFEEGIFPIETAVSEYGTGTTFAIMDTRTWVHRAMGISKNPSLLHTKVQQIAQRSAIIDLMNRNFSLAIRWFPRLQVFGMPIYDSLKRTFQVYSTVLMDLLDTENIKRQIKASSVKEFVRASGAFANIIQYTEIYLERRLEALRDYVLKKKYRSYSDFEATLREQKMEGFLSELKQYIETLNEWDRALRSKTPEDREKTSRALSKWLSEHIDLNPLD